ncbi:hypothetical protein GLS40_08840 [Pseudooceanicola sp. 216_PA32_1]|uniref:Uncharacterized protein n=1 Tax=Pseudooceanicola pacificus TaxID=2676438 RepID=A0A844W2W5_9RHOB|nr:hypothetical protein [Pseudooceanicola pacificus]MWB78127.1 hypothetical protein [Pseudooceanicola pacificus]
MSLPLKLYLDAVRAALANEVLPHVAQDHARSQLLGAMDVIDKLTALADWSPELTAEQSAALAEGLAGMGTAPVRDEDPRARLAAQEATLRAAIDSFYAAAGQDDPTTEAAIRKTLQAYLAAERSRIAAANYSAMT